MKRSHYLLLVSLLLILFTGCMPSSRTDTYQMLMEATITYADGNVFRRVYEYPEDTRLAASCTVYENGEEVGQEIYRWDDQGNMTERREYTDDSLVRRTVTTYSPEGRRQTVIVYDSTDTPLIYHQYSFDSDTEKETMYEYGADGTLLCRYCNSYNTEGNPVTEERYREDGSLISITAYQYSTFRENSIVFE